MHIWSCTRLSDGNSREHGDGGRTTGGQHHGQQTHGKCHAIWHVPIDGQPDGRRRNCSRFRRLGAHAMHSHDHGALGTRRANRTAWQHAGTEQQLQAHVHVGRRDIDQPSRAIHRHGALTHFY